MNKVSVYAGDGKLIYSQYDASIDSVISSAIECMFTNGIKDIIDADNQTELSVWQFLLGRGYRVEVKENLNWARKDNMCEEYIECAWSEETPDACQFCSGEKCNLCGAGMGYTRDECTHDSLERHQFPVPNA